MRPYDTDVLIHELLVERSARRDVPTVVSEQGRVDLRRSRRHATTFRVLVGCAALVLVGVAVAAWQRTGGTSELTASGPGIHLSSFEPDPAQLPPPKWYDHGSNSATGEGSLEVPWTLESSSGELEGGSGASTLVVEWSERVTMTSRSDLRTRMSWSVPDQGGWDPARDLGRTWPEHHARFVERELAGIVFQVATNDPEVTDEQIQALLDRMLRQYSNVTGREVDPTGARLTPRRSELPPMPPTEALEEEFQAMPESERLLLGSAVYSGTDPSVTSYVGYVMPDRARAAFPVFDLHGRLDGIYISGTGIVTRERYEDSDFDPESFVSTRF